jgi:hypothetical protein
VAQGPSLRVFPFKIIRKPNYPHHFAERPLCLLQIKSWSAKFPTEPWNLKIVPNIALATSKNYK